MDNLREISPEPDLPDLSRSLSVEGVCICIIGHLETVEFTTFKVVKTQRRYVAFNVANIDRTLSFSRALSSLFQPRLFFSICKAVPYERLSIFSNDDINRYHGRGD